MFQQQFLKKNLMNGQEIMVRRCSVSRAISEKKLSEKKLVCALLLDNGQEIIMKEKEKDNGQEMIIMTIISTANFSQEFQEM